MEYLVDVLHLTTTQLCITLLPVLLLAWVTHLSSVLVHRNASRALGYRNYLWTFSMVGTVVHEGSHALAASLFGCTIVEMKLFDPRPDASTRGYVRYRFNGQSLVNRLGQIVIGIAPILFGSGILMLFAWVLLEGALFEPWGVLLANRADPTALITREGPSAWLAALSPHAWMAATEQLLGNLTDQTANPGLYVFMLAALAIGSGMHLSSTDTWTMVSGLVSIIGSALIINMALLWAIPQLIDTIYAAIARYLWSAGTLMGIVALMNFIIAMLLSPLVFGAWLRSRAR